METKPENPFKNPLAGELLLGVGAGDVCGDDGHLPQAGLPPARADSAGAREEEKAVFFYNLGEESSTLPRRI